MSRAVLEYVVPWLIDHPEDVVIEEVEDDEGVVFEITAHPDDVGKLIGKMGRIIRSLRVLARAAGQREGRSVGVEVID
ncbi:KH domain-containing protein [soil metagenome]